MTSWQMQTLSGLGFNGYYETGTPGSGTRPDNLARTEQANLSNDGTTGVGRRAGALSMTLRCDIVTHSDY